MAPYIESLEISSYRGIRKLKIDNLGEVNIFVGDNNTGKTSVLEAIQFLCGPNKYNLVQISRQREKYRARMGIGLFDSMRYLFDIKNASDVPMSVEIAGKIYGEKTAVRLYGEIGTQLLDVNELLARQLISKAHLEEQSEEIDTFFGKIEIDFPPDGKLGFLENKTEEFEINNYSKVRADFGKNNTILQSKAILTVDHVIENAFSDLIKNSRIKTRAVELLREEFEDDIVDLRIISDSFNRYTPMVEKRDGEYIPLSLYGDGMKKALTMLNAIVSTQKGVVLIDEFETALHTSAMEQVFSFVTEAARKSAVQLFLTTHSLEAVDKMLESAGAYAKDIRVIRLRKKNGKTFSKVMNGCEALENRREYDLELRV